MRRAFEITSFPDLSLPRYYDLFGDEALTVAATRLFTWLQLASSARQEFSFTLRYRYDPAVPTPNRRLRIFVILDARDDAPASPLLMGQHLVSEVLDLIETTLDHAQPAEEEMTYLGSLERNARLQYSESDALYVPAVWTRQASARNALEPYLDEAFAALTEPAFLDIQLHAGDAQAARQALRSVVSLLERRKQNAQSSGEDFISDFQALGATLAEDPVCRLLVCGGSRTSDAADGILRAFGVDAIGGSRFKVRPYSAGQALYLELREAIANGAWRFADDDGWYSTSLRQALVGSSAGLTPPQLLLLRGLSEVSVLAGAGLIRDVLTLPIPRRGFLRTFPLETENDRRKEPVKFSSATNVLRLGRSLERDSEIELPLADLTRHGFVAGVTGSGKTVTMINVLRQLAEQDVPFLVFEPAKAEYRSMVGFAALKERLRVYTPGRDDLSPLRLNPFSFEGHVTVAQHVAGLSAAFTCALGLFEPVSTILEEALWSLYEETGWREDDRGGSHATLPRVDQIPDRVCRIIDSLGYDAEVTGRFKGVIRSRFIRLSRGSVGRLFDCDRSVPPIDELCSSASLIELKVLTPQEANLVTMFLLLAIREFMSNTVPSAKDRPRLVMVLEEAHNLVPSVPDDHAGGDEVSAKVEASRYVSNMLAEMRALGLAMFIVDQTPAAVASQVLRNTNLKIAHRTVAKQDRDSLADAMLMHPAHAELLGRLVPGQAYVYADRFYRPHLMQAALSEADSSLGTGPARSSADPPSDSELSEWLSGRKWFKEALKARVAESMRGIALIEESLATFADVMQTQLIQWAEITNTSQWEDQRRELIGSWQATSRYWDQRIRSLETEQRAIRPVARRLKVGGVPERDLADVRKVERQIAATIETVAKVQPQ